MDYKNPALSHEVRAERYHRTLGFLNHSTFGRFAVYNGTYVGSFKKRNGDLCITGPGLLFRYDGKIVEYKPESTDGVSFFVQIGAILIGIAIFLKLADEKTNHNSNMDGWGGSG